jgi:hypothetical protein
LRPRDDKLNVDSKISNSKERDPRSDNYKLNVIRDLSNARYQGLETS